MARNAAQRLLFIGDTDRAVSAVVAAALPGAVVRHAASVFDGIAELSQERYSAVLTATEPVGRRPEAAMKTLREMAGNGRLVLFSDPSLEPLSRKMLEFGCDDYLVTPVTAAQVLQVLADRGGEPLRLHSDYDDPRQAKPPVKLADLSGIVAPPAALSELVIGEVLLEALLEHPGEAIPFAVAQLNERLNGAMQLSYSASPAAPVAPGGELARLSSPIATPSAAAGCLIVHVNKADEPAGQALLNQLTPLLCKAATIGQRQSRLQKLAFTDDLTGLFNCRYFKHYLTRILGDARKGRFPVTLFLFDIDNFKSYNDRFGHGAGDDILKQTAALMRRCVRDHDVVARIGGDEFAVVFWEKEGPRMSRESNVGTPGRTPSEPEQILARFRRLLATENYPMLGTSGRGTLTISGGLAVFPYDAQDFKSLIEAADKALMFGAKRSGRNSIALVGGEKVKDNAEC